LLNKFTTFRQCQLQRQRQRQLQMTKHVSMAKAIASSLTTSHFNSSPAAKSSCLLINLIEAFELKLEL